MNAISSFRLCKLTNEQLLEKVDLLTDEMFKNGKIPLRHIPARANDDYDLLIGELILRFHDIFKSQKCTICNGTGRDRRRNEEGNLTSDCTCKCQL